MDLQAAKLANARASRLSSFAMFGFLALSGGLLVASLAHADAMPSAMQTISPMPD